MRIAVCYSGQFRSGARTAQNHKRFFGEMLPYIDTFAHFWDIDSNKRNSASTSQPISQEELNKFVQAHGVKSIKVDNYAEWKEQQITFPENLYYSWDRSIKLMNEYAARNQIKYDAVLRIRPDIILPPERRLAPEVVKCLSERAFLFDNFPPDWLDSMFIDDILWLAPHDIMTFATSYVDVVKNTRLNILLGRYLHFSGVKVGGMLENQYGLLRKECYDFDAHDQYPQCFECDHRFFVAHNPWFDVMFDKDENFLHE